MAPFHAVYKKLYTTFGPQSWWPGETPLEVIIGAVLVQNTSWRNVSGVIEALKKEHLLSIEKLESLPTEELEARLRPVGYFRIKAKRLRHVLEYLRESCNGDLETLFRRPVEALRNELLAVHGIGPETADSILLYAGNLPVFVVDAYTCRIALRHGWIAPNDDYHAVQKRFLATLPEDRQLYNEFHALMVRLGKDYCKRSKPRCDACPLKEWLPK